MLPRRGLAKPLGGLCGTFFGPYILQAAKSGVCQGQLEPPHGYLEPSWGLPCGMYLSLWHTKMPIKKTMQKQQTQLSAQHGRQQAPTT